jgi:hypothetical protein
MLRSVAAALAVGIVACGGNSSTSGQDTFNANLAGANETPANASTATGKAQFIWDGTQMKWTASSTPLAGTLSGFHIHLDTNPGHPGPVVVTLTTGLTQAADKSTVGSGSFNVPDATAKNADGTPMSMLDLVAAMRAGTTYVNMHDTPTYPGGEIRGQVGK